MNVPQEEPCPVADDVLGKMYRASPDGLRELVATVPPMARAMLAVYCSRRAHLNSIGLAIASASALEDLQQTAGRYGGELYRQSRQADPVAREKSARRKVTLSTAKLKDFPSLEEPTVTE